MAIPCGIRASMAGGQGRSPRADEPRDGDRPAQGRSGAIVPAHFIQNVTVAPRREDGALGAMGTSISKNPFMHFRFKGGQSPARR